MKNLKKIIATTMVLCSFSALAIVEEDVANGWEGMGFGFNGLTLSVVQQNTDGTTLIPKRSLETSGAISLDFTYDEAYNLGTLDIYNADLNSQVRSLKDAVAQSTYDGIPVPMGSTGVTGSDADFQGYELWAVETPAGSGNFLPVAKAVVEGIMSIDNYSGPAATVRIMTAEQKFIDDGTTSEYPFNALLDSNGVVPSVALNSVETSYPVVANYEVLMPLDMLMDGSLTGSKGHTHVAQTDLFLKYQPSNL